MKHRARKVMGPDGWLYPEGITFSDTPRPPEEIATDENLRLAALDNQLRIERDEADPIAITADKLATKLPGMAHGVPFIGVVASDAETRKEYIVSAYDHREEDEEILKAEQATHPKGMCDNPHCPCQGRI